MKKDVLIRVRGLQMMDTEDDRNRLKSLFPDSIIIETEAIISVMKK